MRAADGAASPRPRGRLGAALPSRCSGQPRYAIGSRTSHFPARCVKLPLGMGRVPCNPGCHGKCRVPTLLSARCNVLTN